MCGIIGIASRRPVDDRRWIAVGRDAMRHRGPDAAGEWWSDDGRVGFGHRRLAVVDLSPLGNQPMRDAENGLTLVFNGEIYNHVTLREELRADGHRFATRGDTEVLLAAYRAWGANCLDRIDGMFAFALFDARRRSLLLARDRAGEKPLFYSIERGRLRFASELKGLMADPSFERRIDPKGLDAYLAEGFVAGNACLLAGVRKLPPAHALAFDLDSGREVLWRYWDLPPATAPSIPTTDLPRELERELEAAVRRQMVADVPVGILLSGGADSSLIVALAARAAPKVRTFTVRFSGHGTFDESEHARLIAQQFATEHCELEAGEISVELLPTLARHVDEPVANSSMLPTYLLSRLVRQHCTVALGGDGGDELFGGYVHHSRLLWMQRRVGTWPESLRRPVAHAAARWMPLGMPGRKWLRFLDADLRTTLPPINACFDPITRGRVVSCPEALPFDAERDFAEAVPVTGDLLQRATRSDFSRLLAEDILVKLDRATMAHSLEMRAPFLDRKVIEFAFRRVPSTDKATDHGRKLIIRELARRLLPGPFDRNRKHGFQTPLHRWLTGGSWLDHFREVLLDRETTIFDRKYVAGLLDAQTRGRNNAERLFALVLFETWRREHRVAC